MRPRSPVARDVLAELPRPELHIALRGVGGTCTPNAGARSSRAQRRPLDAFGYNVVRSTWELSRMQPEPEAQSVQNGAYLTFGCGVPTSNPGHVPASAFARQSVRHPEMCDTRRRAFRRPSIEVEGSSPTLPALAVSVASAHPSARAQLQRSGAGTMKFERARWTAVESATIYRVRL